MIYIGPLVYIIIINIIAFLAMLWDKRKASHNEWRVAETTLYILGFLGGAIGILVGMYKFRHKTKKRTFQVIAIVGLIISLVIYFIVISHYI
ncbi:MAG: DUF1294 domain-containing protein [Candidatus Thorarchaeota archaeon]|nr:DUF1294 domain-containing protein [Candidatus Thorarchaeota archaeon]